jgi:hypothetical protein
MGCAGTRTLVETKKRKSSTISTLEPRKHSHEEYVYDHEVKKRAISINQSIFINERDYSEFKNEYEILRHIGSGMV